MDLHLCDPRNRILMVASVLVLFSAPVFAEPISNQRTAERVFIEKMGLGRFDISPQIYARDFVAHGTAKNYTLDEDNQSGREWRRAFPDLKVSVLRSVSSGDLVAVHWHASGTNTIAAAGLPGNGRRASIDGMTFFRFAGAKIAEEWSVIDLATMMAQLADRK